MRLFLIPISTKRAFVYCPPGKLTQKPSILDRVTSKAAKTWENWERADKGWRKKLVAYGNVILQRIPYQEWGLKSIPPYNTWRQFQQVLGKKEVEVMYPGNAIKSERVFDVLRTLGTERQEHHRKKMWWSFLIAPLTAPIALIPVVPNIPFFYLAYRGWSHWRALNGSRCLVLLLDNGLIVPQPTPALEAFYSKRISALKPSQGVVKDSKIEEKEEDELLVSEKDGKQLGELLNAPEIAIEVERAVIQIRQNFKSKAGPPKEKAN